VGEHLDFTLLGSRPLLRRAIPIKLNPVAVRVAQIQGLAYPVIGCSLQGNARLYQPSQRIGQIGS